MTGYEVAGLAHMAEILAKRFTVGVDEGITGRPEQGLQGCSRWLRLAVRTTVNQGYRNRQTS